MELANSISIHYGHKFFQSAYLTFIRSCLQLASQQELVHDSQESVNLATLPPRRGGHRKATTPPLFELISIVSFTNHQRFILFFLFTEPGQRISFPIYMS